MYLLKSLSITVLLISAALSGEFTLSNLQENDCLVVDLTQAPQLEQKQFELYNTITTTEKVEQTIISGIQYKNIPIDLTDLNYFCLGDYFVKFNSRRKHEKSSFLIINSKTLDSRILDVQIEPTILSTNARPKDLEMFEDGILIHQRNGEILLQIENSNCIFKKINIDSDIEEINKKYRGFSLLPFGNNKLFVSSYGKIKINIFDPCTMTITKKIPLPHVKNMINEFCTSYKEDSVVLSSGFWGDRETYHYIRSITSESIEFIDYKILPKYFKTTGMVLINKYLFTVALRQQKNVKGFNGLFLVYDILNQNHIFFTFFDQCPMGMYHNGYFLLIPSAFKRKFVETEKRGYIIYKKENLIALNIKHFLS